ncbi:MAG: translocation/assembly module TamB domain-containing protein [Anaeromyxobacter sp.]
MEAHRGKGKLLARASLRGLRTPPAKLEGRIDAERVLLTRAGMEVATIDLAADAGGTWRPGALDARLDVSSATIRLPKKIPRTLQSLEERPDIVIGRKRERPPTIGGESMAIKARLVAPGGVRVSSDDPRIQISLRADVTYEREKGNDYLTGTVETTRGFVEPIGGRVFEVKRGKLTFTGGPPKAALLDVSASWDNPQAKVTVTVAGPLASPEIRMTSQPPLDEGQIALLIATGRTELKAGQGGLTSMGGDSEGSSGGLGTLGGLGATFLFKNVLQDKLPFDTMAVDSTAVRAGKYVLDNKVYIGYTRRFDARIEKGENQNEARVEYQMTPRWTLEWRYGDGQSGNASLLWTKEY